MIQKAVDNVLKRVNRLINWWVEQQRITGKSHRVITISDADFKTLKADIPVCKLCGLTENTDGTFSYQEFVLTRTEDKNPTEGNV
jgi:hypothetical protein